MMGARPFLIALLIVSIALVVSALAVSAGTQEDPEVTDPSGDAGGRESHDLIKAWVHDEDNETLTFRMELTALDAISPRDDWLTLPTTIYEYYFTIKSKDYALRATVPVHGPFAALANFNLYAVTYGEADNMTYEAVGSVTGNYYYNDASIQWVVDKSNIENPTQGDLVSHMWAASYFQPRGENREQMDEAMSYDEPGRDYVVRGKYSQLYDVRLRTDNATRTGVPHDVTSYNITIVSDSTTNVEINITNSSLPAGYFVNYSLKMPIAVPEHGSVSFNLVVSVPDDAANGTDVMIILTGHYMTQEGDELATNELNLLLQVRFVPPKPPEEERTIFTILRDFVQDYYLYLIVVVVIAIVALLVWLFLGQRNKREDELLHEYQSYLESQGQKREMGEV